MTELFFLLTQFFLIYILASFNFLEVSIKDKKKNILSYPENIAFNLIIFTNFILIISFFNFNLDIIIKSYIAYIIILGLFYLHKFKNVTILNEERIFYFLLLFVSSMIIFIEVANNLALGWDVQKFWIYKTLNFYNGNSIENLSNIAHSWYPHLGTLIWSFFWKLSLINYEYFGRLFYVFLYLSSLLLLVYNFRLSKFYKTIFFISLIIISYDYSYHSLWSMFSGYQEILIFSLLTISIHFLYNLTLKNKKRENLNILSIILICNSLIWIKHEGMIISLSLILTLILFFDFNKRKKTIIFFSFFLIIFLRFFIFDIYDLNSSGIQHSNYSNLELKEILGKISLDRIFIVSKFLLLNLFSNYLFLIAILILAILKLKNKKLKKMNYFFFLIIFNILAFSGIYIITDADIIVMLKQGLDRIIYQFSPFVFLLFLTVFNNKRINLS